LISQSRGLGDVYKRQATGAIREGLVNEFEATLSRSITNGSVESHYAIET
jgi:hypothetical protein